MTTARWCFVLLGLALAGCTGAPSAPAVPVTTQLEGAWSDPATWGGALPDANSSVTVPAGKTVTLDGKVAVRNLTVMGRLVCADRDLALTANWIMVHAPGSLECGTAAKPFTKRLEIVLSTGDEAENAMGMGTKFFGAMGGTVDLHGEPRTSWTTLSATAAPGARQINVLEAGNWRAGDRIAIAPTDFDPLETEERTVTAVTGTTLTLDAGLEHQHWGKVQVLGSTGQTMIERAEVANLTRNIVIRGQNAPGSTFGGHVMFMAGATARLSNIEVTGMGQLGKLGRYPVHFHLLGDGGKGSYLNNAAVHANFQRGIVVHRTNDLLVENNVVYKTMGHMVFLESSNEVRNTFSNNLVMLTRPIPADRLNPDIGFDHQPDHQNATSRVSGFWISNQHNTFNNNHVVGILQGHGYWFVEANALYQGRDNDLWEYRPGGPGYDRAPYRGRLEFTGNVAHTIRSASEYGGSNPMRVAGNAIMLDAVRLEAGLVPTLKDTRVWKVPMYAVWGLAGTNTAPIIDGLVVADSKSAVFNGEHNGPLALRGGTLYGMTDNQPPGVSASARNWAALFQSFGQFPDDLQVEFVTTYPDTIRASAMDGTVPERLMLEPGTVTGGQRFTAFSNVTLGGWRR
jgi:cell migration-inducing and hyaluronan-binding protein